MMTVCISEQSALLSMKELQSVTLDVGETERVFMYREILFRINNIKTPFCMLMHGCVCNVFIHGSVAQLSGTFSCKNSTLTSNLR